MLIILSGAETINRKTIAMEILQALNTWTIDGYTVRFKNHAPYITDSTGQVVYKAKDEEGDSITSLLVDLDNDGAADPEGLSIFNQAIDIQKTVLLDGVRDNHFGPNFISFYYDFGVETEIRFEGGINYVHKKSYEEIIDLYRNRTYEFYVISGSFGKGFFDKARQDLGDENVTMINITRNPSVIKLLHRKDQSYYEKNAPDYTETFDENKMFNSIGSCASLKRLQTVINLKFEDILAAGHFMLLGKEIKIPASYVPYNQWITVWEYENSVNKGYTDAIELDDFNVIILDTASHFANDPEYDPRFPRNLFESTGYSPLSLGEIIFRDSD